MAYGMVCNGTDCVTELGRQARLAYEALAHDARQGARNNDAELQMAE
jgi:hypothetical protein